MKTRKLRFFALLLAAVMPVFFGTPAYGAYAAEALPRSTIEISGQKMWNDLDDAAGLRPEEITVRLLADGQEIASTKAAAAAGWKFSFTVSPAEGHVPVYTIVEDEVSFYTEAADLHGDPTADFEYPVSAEWEKYEPCAELEIPVSRLRYEIIGGKMTGGAPFLIWSPKPLTPTEKTLIWASVKGLPGVGNPKEVVFVSGAGDTGYGLTVDAENGKLWMESPGKWALLFGGTYIEHGEGKLSASLTNELLPLDPGPGGGQGYDTPQNPPEEPGPGVDVIPEPPEGPGPGVDVIPESPEEPGPGVDVIPESPEEPGPGVDVIPESPEDPGPGVDVIPEPPEEPGPGVDMPLEPPEEPGRDFDVLPESPEEPGPGIDLTPEPAPVIVPTVSPAPVPAVTPAPTPVREQNTDSGTEHALDPQPATGLPADMVLWSILSAVSAVGLTAVLAAGGKKRRR